jgi:hypothetical protein
VLARGIQDEPRARLDDDREPEVREAPPERREVLGARREGVEVVDVGRQRDPVVAQVGEDRRRVVEAVEREAVRVVEEGVQAARLTC